MLMLLVPKLHVNKNSETVVLISYRCIRACNAPPALNSELQHKLLPRHQNYDGGRAVPARKKNEAQDEYRRPTE